MDHLSPIIPESEPDADSDCSGSLCLSPVDKTPLFPSNSDLRRRRKALKEFTELPARRELSPSETKRIEELAEMIVGEKQNRKYRCRLPRPLLCTRYPHPLPRPYFDPSYVPEPHDPEIPLELPNTEEEWTLQQSSRDKKRAEKQLLREKVVGWQASISDLDAAVETLSAKSVEQELLVTDVGTSLPTSMSAASVAKTAEATKVEGLDNFHTTALDAFEELPDSLPHAGELVLLEPPQHSTPRPRQASTPADISLFFQQPLQVITPIRQLASPPDSRADPPMELARPETPTRSQGTRSAGSQLGTKRRRSLSPEETQYTRVSKFNPFGVFTPHRPAASSDPAFPSTPTSTGLSLSKRNVSWSQSHIPSSPSSAREALQRLPTMQQLMRESAKKKRAGLSQSATLPSISPTKSRLDSQAKSEAEMGCSLSTTDYLYASQPTPIRPTEVMSSQNRDESYRQELDSAAANVVQTVVPVEAVARAAWDVSSSSPYGDRIMNPGMDELAKEIAYDSQFKLSQDVEAVTKFMQDDIGDVYG